MSPIEAIIKIREATESDTPTILRLWRDLMDYNAERDPHFTRADDGDTVFENWLSQVRESEDGLVLVAEEDSAVIGYLLATETSKPGVFIDPRMGMISDISVFGGDRRRGVGINLVKSAVYWFKERGVERIECHVSLFNETARGFWRAVGFAPYMETLYFKGA